MEGTHCELGARLADRLGGDDADRFAVVHRSSPGEVAAVALYAHADLGFAGQHRTDANLLNAGLRDLLDIDFREHGVLRSDDLAGLQMRNILRHGAAENAHAERRDDLARIDDRTDADAIAGAAILFRDDAVLGDVDETAGQ